jgi:hypothetical protein
MAIRVRVPDTRRVPDRWVRVRVPDTRRVPDRRVRVQVRGRFFTRG